MKFRRPIFYLILASALFLLAGYSCPDLIDISQNDTTPPEVKICIEYHVKGTSEPRKLYLTAADASTTINADGNYPVLVTYSGVDYQGVKLIHIDVKVIKDLGNDIVQVEFFNIMPVVTETPKIFLEDTWTFQQDKGPRTAEISALAENWAELTTFSKKHTIIIE
ncbi:MAG: hypothetical protein JW969_05155 [Spirochaetales bacterium]|nr:hypothetical protein [Spirochaetales bacterium]